MDPCWCIIINQSPRFTLGSSLGGVVYLIFLLLSKYNRIHVSSGKGLSAAFSWPQSIYWWVFIILPVEDQPESERHLIGLHFSLWHNICHLISFTNPPTEERKPTLTGPGEYQLPTCCSSTQSPFLCSTFSSLHRVHYSLRRWCWPWFGGPNGMWLAKHGQQWRKRYWAL